MPTTPTISKVNASFPPEVDYEALRLAGIAHCQALGGDLWTDYNLHDPGVTILEAVTYALTDVWYRRHLPLEDLLTPSHEADAGPGPDGKPFDDNFFTAEQILTCNPVTLDDLRRLLIDVPGVANAWVEPADAAEVTIYVDEKADGGRGTLQYAVPAHLAGDGDAIAAATVVPDGLYLVYLALDDDLERDACGDEAVPVDRILRDVWTLLRRHRNLCEDVLDVVVLGDEHVALCADVELAADAAPDDVLLGIYQAVDAFLAPRLQFYTLQEMLARGVPMEDVYAGRPLAPLRGLVDGCGADAPYAGAGTCSHGFLDPAELAATERRTEVHASDLVQVIMDVPGVLAIRRLTLVNYVNGLAQTRGEPWCLHLTPGYRPVFDLDRSPITFYKGVLPFPADRETVRRRIGEERAARTKTPLDPAFLDRPVPAGRHRPDLQDYRGVAHDFPLVYGIGDDGVPESASAERRARVQQLRGYLLFYDQLLANYLAQLGNLRELFSLRPDADRTDEQNRTYFASPLTDEPGAEGVPGLAELLRDSSGGATDYTDYLPLLVEDDEGYAERRNGFLDHLLARFAESFTDYVLLMYDVEGRRRTTDRVIRDKGRFLATYPETSRDRGRAFDYAQPDGWDTDNVSGLERRVARLLGLADDQERCDGALAGEGPSSTARRRLAHVGVEDVEGAWHYRVSLPGDAPDASLLSRLGFDSKPDARDALRAFWQRAREESAYRRLEVHGFHHHGFAVLEPDPSGEDPCGYTRADLARVDALWPTEDERDDALHAAAAVAALPDPPPLVVERRDGRWTFRLAVTLPEGAELTFSSARSWETETAARQAGNAFAAQAADPRQYRRTSRDGFTHYAFAMVDAAGDVLVQTPPWPERGARDVAVFRLIERALGGALACRVGQTAAGFAFAVEADLEQLLGTHRYPDAAAAWHACTRLLPRLTDPDAYRLEPDGESAYRLVVLDGADVPVAESGPGTEDEMTALRDLFVEKSGEQRELPESYEQRPAAWRCHLLGDSAVLLRSVYQHPYDVWARLVGFRQPGPRDAAREAVQHFFETTTDPVPDVEEEDGDYYFVFHIAEELELRGWRGHATPGEARASAGRMAGQALNADAFRPWRDTETGRYGFDVYDHAAARGENRPDAPCEQGRGGAYGAACADCDALAERLQDEDAYRLIDAPEDGLYGFEVVAPGGRLMAHHDAFYADATERDAHIEIARCLADAEGMHLVEHLLLRPRHGGVAPAFVLTAETEGSGEPLARSTAAFADEKAAARALGGVLDRLVGGEAVAEPVDGTVDGTVFGFRLVDAAGAEVAEGTRTYCDAAARDEAVSALVTDVQARFADPASRTPEALLPYVHAAHPAGDRAADALLPLGSGCRDEAGRLCPIQSDPYSFRATVVVPYWPRRFREVAFRRHFEQTLRMEAPAHVFLRICWVGVCQMRTFETAFERWLRALALTEGSCDRTAAQKALVDVLFCLRSVYSTAHLIDCDAPAADCGFRPVVLDQTLLGTAPDDDHADDQ